MRTMIVSLLMLVMFSACDKKNETPETNGVLQSLALDGCTNVIVLDDGTRLEPVLNSSGVELQLNKRFAFRYRVKPAASICMVGETIEITSLRYL